jgi:hypothetical protein
MVSESEEEVSFQDCIINPLNEALDFLEKTHATDRKRKLDAINEGNKQSLEDCQGVETFHLREAVEASAT